MKNLFLLMMSLAMLVACGGKGAKNAQNAASPDTKGADTSMVYVYYFHGKQRCITCIAVEKVAKEAVEQNFGTNDKVKYQVLPTDDKANEALVGRYEISWNGLIVAKGDNAINITEEAFANAVDNPNVLVELIKTEVNNRLKQ